MSYASTIYALAGPARKASQQRIFDHQQPAELLDRDRELLGPASRRPWRTVIPRPARKPAGQPIHHRQSMGAAVRLKTCGFHNAGPDSEVEADPGLLGGAAGLAGEVTASEGG